MIAMCKACLDKYGMTHPAMQIFGETCSCCDNPCVTVCMVTEPMPVVVWEFPMTLTFRYVMSLLRDCA